METIAGCVVVGLAGGFAISLCYTCKAYCDRRLPQRRLPETSLNRVLLNNAEAIPQIEEDPPLTRQDIELGLGDHDSWKCSICEFCNALDKKFCVLCGTDKGIKFGDDDEIGCHILQDEAKQSIKSKEIDHDNSKAETIITKRSLNKLNARQRCARKRMEWVRKINHNGTRQWCRKSFELDADVPTNRRSVGYVARLVERPSDGIERLTFLDCCEANPMESSYGLNYTLYDDDELERVTSLTFQEKYKWFLEQTSLLMNSWEDGRLKLRIHRENVLVESMEQILGVQLQHIRLPLRIEFIGESGIDAGGLEREWFAMLSDQLFDNNVGLFHSCHKDIGTFTINPNSSNASIDHLLYFRGIGRVIGRAFLEGQIMPARLCLPLFKHILNTPISFSDLEFVDPEIYRSMKWIRDNEGVENLYLDFTVLNNSSEVIELKPDGANIPVTDINKQEYLHLRLKYIMLTSIAPQLRNLLSGIFEVIPQELLMVFNYPELELVLCGIPEIDLNDWRQHTIISENLIGNNLVDWFWQIMEEFSLEERARLIQFTTGSSRLPVQGFKGLTSYDGRICLFTLKGIPYHEHAFPKAHTCFNRLDLPLYKTKKELIETLYYIITMDITGFTDQ